MPMPAPRRPRRSALLAWLLARTAMRQQRACRGGCSISPLPTLIVPSVMEQEAYQYPPQFVPAKSADVNNSAQVVARHLEPVVEPILDAVSVSQWYLVADGNARHGRVLLPRRRRWRGAGTNQTVDVDGVNFRPAVGFRCPCGRMARHLARFQDLIDLTRGRLATRKFHAELQRPR